MKADDLAEAIEQAHWVENRALAARREAETALRITPWYRAPIRVLRLRRALRKLNRDVL